MILNKLYIFFTFLLRLIVIFIYFFVSFREPYEREDGMVEERFTIRNTND